MQKYSILFVSCLFFSNIQAKSLCVAHRGNNVAELENSLTAIISSVKVGSDAVEFDVVHTKDMFPIIMHDKKLKRMAISKPSKVCDRKTSIEKQTWKQINDNCQLKNGEDIPTLEDFLDYLSGENIIAVIELKDKPTQITTDIIEHFYSGLEDKLRVISFKTKFLDKIWESSEFFQNVSFLKLYKILIKSNKKYGINIYSPLMKLSLKSNKRGLENGTWTIDKPEKIKKAMDLGINLITTNDPALCMSLKTP
jgi:glycerophosphoryl diester phosphodiesterase